MYLGVSHVSIVSGGIEGIFGNKNCDSPFVTHPSIMNSLTELSISWYFAVAAVMLWMMVVTWPKMAAYSSDEMIIMQRQNTWPGKLDWYF